jgi:catechol 2,3-dioxygenase
VAEEPIHPDTRIGHIHLKVSDLERSVRFYTEVMGFELMTKYGDQAAFLSAGGYHHHIGLNTWESLGGLPPPRGTTGLYHFAILLPDRLELARTFRRMLDQGWPIEGASDHGVSEAIYLRDPDDNGIEIYADRPKEEWPRRDGELEMTTRALNLRQLLADLAAAESKG